MSAVESYVKVQYDLHGLRVFFPEFWTGSGAVLKHFYNGYFRGCNALADIAQRWGLYDEWKKYRHHLTQTREHTLWSKFDTVCTGNIWLATKMGKWLTVSKLLKKHPRLLNQNDQYDSSILYYAAFCGHENILDMLLDMGGSCDWDRAIAKTPTLKMRAKLRRYKTRNEAAKTIQKHMHDWLWKPKPRTRDGKYGIHMRLVLRDAATDNLLISEN